MTYDPLPYWNDQARNLAGPGAASPEHERQEEALMLILKPLYWRSVLEVGVGGGRITDLLHRMRPKSKYMGIDIGPVQLAAAKKVWKNGEFEQVAIEDFDELDGWDLVIASEVLMHVKPKYIADALANMLKAAKKHVVFIEWDAQPADRAKPIAPFNFPHDYRHEIEELGYSIESETQTDYQTIFHVRV